MHRVHQAVRDVCDVCPTGLQPLPEVHELYADEALLCINAGSRKAASAWPDLHADHCVAPFLNKCRISCCKLGSDGLITGIRRLALAVPREVGLSN
jgi:hypothetical protein